MLAMNTKFFIVLLMGMPEVVNASKVSSRCNGPDALRKGGDDVETVVRARETSVSPTRWVFAAASDFHHAGFVRVFTVLAAVFLSLINHTITD